MKKKTTPQAPTKKTAPRAKPATRPEAATTLTTPPAPPVALPPSWPEVMTVADLAAYLQVATKTIYGLANAGEIPAAKVGEQWRFKRSLIDQWVEARSLQNYTGPDLGDPDKVKEED